MYKRSEETIMGDDLGPAKEAAQADEEATIKKRADEAKEGMDAEHQLTVPRVGGKSREAAEYIKARNIETRKDR